MEIEANIYYPTEGFGETVSVNVESGESLIEAIQARGAAQYEFIVADS